MGYFRDSLTNSSKAPDPNKGPLLLPFSFNQESKDQRNTNIEHPLRKPMKIIKRKPLPLSDGMWKKEDGNTYTDVYGPLHPKP